MKLDALRDFTKSAPGPTGPEIDAKARAWLASGGLTVAEGEGDPVVLVVLAVDLDRDFEAFALPADSVDDAAHRDLAALHGAAFEHFFVNDLRADQFAGAFRICGGRSDEPDVFSEQIDEMKDEIDEEIDLDYDALEAAAGSFLEHRLKSGATLPGPITHVYVATLCT